MACRYLYQGKWYTEQQLKGIYEQLGGDATTPSKASPGTIKKIREFLDRIGVETQSLSKITYNGKSLGVNGLADPLNGLIQVIEGKEDIALPEEAMHMAVELIEQKNPKLFKDMMDRVGRYNLFNQVMAEYQNNQFYQNSEGKPDVRKIKKETIGKILAQTVINKNQDANEKPELLSQTRIWWQAIVDFLKDLFLRAGFNPFEQTASRVLSGKLTGPLSSTEEKPFASRNSNARKINIDQILSRYSDKSPYEGVMSDRDYARDMLVPLYEKLNRGEKITTDDFPPDGFHTFREFVKSLSFNIDTKLTDNGEPVILFHGSPSKFGTFREEFLGSYTNAPSAKQAFFAAKDVSTAIQYGEKDKEAENQLGVLEGDNPEPDWEYDEYRRIMSLPEDDPEKIAYNENQKRVAESAREAEGKYFEWEYENKRRDERVKFRTKTNLYPLFFISKNPLIVDVKGNRKNIGSINETLIKAKQDGYDAVVFKDVYDGGEGNTDVYTVFSSSQIVNILDAINTQYAGGDAYFQLSEPPLADKIVDKHINITKKGDEFEINNNKIRNSVQKEIQSFYKKRLGAANADKALRGFKQETESKVQVDIQDILSRYVDDDNLLRITPLRQTNPSAVDPNDNSLYMTLEAHLQERLNSYEPGTKFIHSVNLYDGMNTAGRADLIAITPQGKVDVLQFKVPQLSKVGSDIPVYRQEAYNLEVEELRKILQRGYGVARADFRQTRAIPIKAEYAPVAPGISDLRLNKLTIGSVNVALIQDDLLLPIASESELTESERFDEFINRLKGLVQRLASERVAPEQRAERNKRVSQLVGAIRKLQIKKDGKGVLASAQTIIKRAKERSATLREKITNTDPNVATIEELDKIAEEILSDKDQVEIYKDLYGVFKNTFTDGTVESEDIIKEARGISDDANDIIDIYWETAVKFRTSKFAAKVGIKDEFSPEKKLTWYRRMIRSLSQSSTKAGQQLWRLVERINGRFKLEFLDRLDALKTIEKDVTTWMKGRPIEELYKKIFQYDAKGRWNGRIIQKIDRRFYEELKKAQENKDTKWIKENIDKEKYMEWYREEHRRRLADARTARYSADDAENARIIHQNLQDFVDTFHIDFKKGIGIYNWALKNFPKEENWKSAEYQELERNKPLLDLYNYYRTRLEESWNLGMLQEHNGWSWFPNVRRNLFEKLSSAPASGKVKSLFGSVRIEAEDQTFGKIDPITGKPIDEIHANFVSDLGTYVEDADGSYFLDYSEKSMDIFKVIALWDAEILKYRLRTESENIARLLHYTEADPRRKAYESTPTGKLRRTPDGKPIAISNEVNARYIKEHIDSVYYGKAKSDEFDITIDIPYKAAVEKINKLFGREVLAVPKEETVRISGIKAIEAMNRYYVAKTLGLNVMTSVAQLFGGSINTFINQGRYFNKRDMLEAEAKYVSGKFYANDQDKKLAGLVSFLHPYTEDRTSAMIRKMSVSKMVEYLSSDHLFYLQRGSDNWVNSIVALSMIKNTMVVEGKLVNMREFARRELGHANKYDGTYAETKEFDKRLDARVIELQNSPQALINYSQVVDDQMVVPGVDRNGDEVIRLRQQILEMIKDALGNTSSEDLSLYKRYVTWQSFFMFKNWIPRMLDVRAGSLKYSAGTDKYEYGRVRMLVNAVKHMGASSLVNLTKLLGNNSEPLIEVARKEYTRKRQAFAEEQQELEMSEAEFIDMYIKGVRSEVKELLLAASLMGLLIAMRLNAPDSDDDVETKGAYRWALRGLDKLTDELTFMYTPTSFTSILNGSVFPAVGILVEFQRFFTSVIEKLFFNLIDDEEKAAKIHPSKYVFRMLPITKEAIQYLAIFNDDLAKEYGIRMSSNYGSVR